MEAITFALSMPHIVIITLSTIIPLIATLQTLNQTLKQVAKGHTHGLKMVAKPMQNRGAHRIILPTVFCICIAKTLQVQQKQ